MFKNCGKKENLTSQLDSKEEKELICPACFTTLSKITVGDFIVDACKNGCAGVWFEEGEFEKMDEEHEFPYSEILSYEPKEYIETKKGAKNCPYCRIKMKAYFLTEKKIVEIDECEKCNGIWLDAGELNRIRAMHKTKDSRKEAMQNHFDKISAQIVSGLRKKEQDDKSLQFSKKILCAINAKNQTLKE